jgi:hypothetical protein
MADYRVDQFPSDRPVLTQSRAISISGPDSRLTGIVISCDRPACAPVTVMAGAAKNRGEKSAKGEI